MTSALGAWGAAARSGGLWRRVISINWGAWRDVGMAARRISTHARPDQRDTFLRVAMAPDVAMEAFGRVLASAHTRVVVTGYDLRRAIAQPVRKHERADTA